MRQALAGGEIVDQSPPPVELGHIHPGFGGDESGTEGTEHPVEGSEVRPRPGSEAFEQLEGVELGEPGPGSAFAAEADFGQLCGGEHSVVFEEATQLTVPLGDPTERRQQSMIEIPPAPTTPGVRALGP